MFRVLCLAATLACLPALALADSMSAIKEAAKKQASSRIAEELNLPSPAPADARVYFIEPADGATLSGPVKVVFGLSGMGVAPAGTQVDGTGHHHLLVDGPTVNVSQPLPASEQVIHFGKGQTETTLELAPGTHTLQLMFADWKHQPFNPGITSDTISITVE